ncbi:hypothetical protein FOZ60_015480 [Perkinsus olseni]|uniref:Uncharacterized protein n=1 Tax=Perkinsus olseni TaxID=32597 RepID=A0A7J6N5N1_PEROL|nr:hypothetical protein FOZ60_015480 [Perkinsus olseni]
MPTSARIAKQKRRELEKLQSQNHRIADMFKKMKKKARTDGVPHSSARDPSARCRTSTSSQSKLDIEQRKMVHEPSSSSMSMMDDESSGGCREDQPEAQKTIAVDKDGIAFFIDNTGESSSASNRVGDDGARERRGIKRKHCADDAVDKARAQLKKWQTLHNELETLAVSSTPDGPALQCSVCNALKAMTRPIVERVVVLVHAALLCLVVGCAQRNSSHLVKAFSAYGANPPKSAWQSYGYSWQFVLAAWRVIRRHLAAQVMDSPLHAVSFDLSTDISTKKRLAFVVAYAGKDGDARQSVLGFTQSPGKSADIAERIERFYEESGIDPSRCTAAITDGGGAEKKAYELLRGKGYFQDSSTWHHCAAHRISLSVEDCWETSPFCKSVESLFICIYGEFNRSSPRLERLRALQLSCLRPILLHSAALLSYYDASENASRSPEHLHLLRDSNGDGPLCQLWDILQKIGDHVVQLQAEALSLSGGMRIVSALEGVLTMSLNNLSREVKPFVLGLIKRLSVRIPIEERQAAMEEATLADPVAITGARGLQLGSAEGGDLQQYVIACRDLRIRQGSLSSRDLIDIAKSTGSEDLLTRVIRGVVKVPTSCSAERCFSVLTRELSSSRNRLDGENLEADILLCANRDLLLALLENDEASTGGVGGGLAEVAHEWLALKNRREKTRGNKDDDDQCHDN